MGKKVKADVSTIIAQTTPLAIGNLFNDIDLQVECIALFDRSFHCVAASQSDSLLVNVSVLSNPVGKHLNDIFPSKLAGHIHDSIINVFNDGLKVERVFSYATKDAEYQLRGTFMRIHLPALNDTLVAWVQYTCRRIELNGTQESLMVYQRVIEGLNAIVLVVDASSRRIIMGNSIARKFYGYTPTTIEGMRYRTILGITEKNEKGLVAKILAEKQSRFIRNHQIASGGSKPVETHASSIIIGESPYIVSLSFEIAVRSKLEKELRRNLDIFQSFFKENSLPLILVEPDSLNIIEANAKAQNLLGIPPSRLKNIPFSEFSAQETNVFNSSIRSFFEKDYSGLELPFRTANNTIRNIELHFTIVEIGRERLLLYILVDVSERNLAISALKDGKEQLSEEVKRQTSDLVRINNSLIEQINRRKKAEEELRQSEAMFFRLFQLNPSGTLLIDVRTKAIAEVNQSFLRTMGFSKKQLLSKLIDELPIHTEPIDFHSLQQSLMEGNHVNEIPIKVRSSDGNERYVLFSAEIVNFERGNYMIQVFQDITEIRLAQQRIEQSEKRFRTMIENNTDIILIVDPHGYGIYYSPSVTKELGYSIPNDRKLNVLAFCHHEDRASLQAILNGMSSGSMKVCSEQVRVRQISGSYRTFEFTANNLLSDPSIGGIIVNARDITEQARAREEINNALKHEQELSLNKTQFISTVSHEFRTPLSNLSLNIQLLKKYIVQHRTDLAGQNLKRMENAIKRLTNLVNEASLISKDQSGRLLYSSEMISTHHLIDYLLDQFSYLLIPRVSVQIDKGEYQRVFADKNLISHIVGNLLGNALKFSPEPGSIYLKLKVDSNLNLQFIVEDKGIGIPEDEIKYLFDPYFRASNIKQIGGTGLGLSIVKRCIDLHGGTVTITSKVGEGTSVCCTIPLVLST